MTLAQTSAVRTASAPLETRSLGHEMARRARRADRTARAREARLKLNGTRGRGDFSHLTRCYD